MASARKLKRRVSRLMWVQIYIVRYLMLDELIAWDRMQPVGREFGSPDFEHLAQLDIERWIYEKKQNTE